MDTPVIDFHAHGGGWTTLALDAEPELYVRNMDAAGIDAACINCIWYGDARRANDLIVETYLEPYPERFIGVAFVTPFYPEEAISELERAFDQLDMKMLKTYPTYFNKPMDDPAYFPIYEWANDRGICIMCHGTYTVDPPGTTVLKRYASLTERFPNIKWVIAHVGSGISSDPTDAAKELPNVWLETCGSGSSVGSIKFAVDHAGADRVLFGTDMPIFDARHQVGKVVTADISTEAKQRVLGLNAIDLLGLDVKQFGTYGNLDRA